MKLEIGYNGSFEVRKEKCAASCEKFSVLYLSDFHFNKYSRDITLKIIDRINELNPDIILLGGDYVDSKSGLRFLNTLMTAISHRKHVFAVAGNHDYFFGLSEIKKIMRAHHAVWIEKDTATIVFKNTVIQIDGNKPAAQKNRADFSILCLHKPIDIRRCKDNYNLVFAGHLHGSQVVFWRSKNGLYPGRLFYRWNILKTRSGDCQYFISKGLGDTLPLRYNCKKDVLFVEVAPH